MSKNYKKDLLYEQLRQAIYTGTYPVGSKLPREIDFARELGVSFITLRAALKRLEGDGLITRLRSRGTFVNELPAAATLDDEKKKLLIIFPARESSEILRNNIFNRHLFLGCSGECALQNAELISEYLDDPEQLLPRYLAGEFAGIVWDRPVNPDDIVGRLKRAGVPQVLINRDFDGLPSVTADYPALFRMGVRALRDIGHRHIMLIDFGIGAPVFTGRREAFVAQIRLAGIADADAYAVDLGVLPEEQRAQVIADRLRRLPQTTAVIISNVFIEEFESCLEALGIPVPRELSVIQFGEKFHYERNNAKPYSILTEPRTQVGQAAAELLFRQLRGEDCTALKKLVDGELIMRNGCALPRNIKLETQEV